MRSNSFSEAMPSGADVAVIGGGVIGASTAYYLSRDGHRVILLERGELAGGASGANVGSIAVHTMDRGLLLQMALYSARIYSSLELELECDLEYQRLGALVIVQTEEEWEYMQHLVEGQVEAGLSAELLRGEEARRLEPALGPAVVGASYCTSHAQLNPQRLTLSYARAARRLGATILTRTPVIGIEMQGGRVLGVQTPQGRVHASWVVNAAGVGASAVGRMVGIQYAITPRRGQVLVTERSPGLVRTKVSSAGDILAKYRAQSGQSIGLGLGLSLSPTPAGNLMLGGTNESAGEEIATSSAAARAISSNLFRIMPSLRGARIVRGWAGLRPVTQDGLPLLGRVDGLEGYLVAAGHCGHGIGLAPFTGRYLARTVASGGKGPSPGEFLADE